MRVRLPLRPHLPRPDARQDPRAPRHRQAAGQEGNTGQSCIKIMIFDHKDQDHLIDHDLFHDLDHW